MRGLVHEHAEAVRVARRLASNGGGERRIVSVRHLQDGAARGKLEALSPLKVLARGFSLTQRADGRVVTSAGDVSPGERITVRVHDGGIDATVEGTRKKT